MFDGIKKKLSNMSFWLFFACTYGAAWLLTFKFGVRLPSMLTSADLDANSSFLVMLTILGSFVPVIGLIVWFVVSEITKNILMRISAIND